MAAAGTGSWPLARCVSEITHTAHTGRTDACTCAERTGGRPTRAQRACRGWTCAYVHACTARAHPGYMRARTHTQRAHTGVTCAWVPTAHTVCMCTCVYIHRGPTQRPRFSLNKERPPGMLVSPLFLSPVRQPGLHRTLHFALALPSSCPLSLSPPAPQPPSFLPG